ncbi:sensor histidine kinase [Mucilaginibacter pedocola]|uniref:histidine kinase n=1 Tax=Mucilaginibacter pedocola TaxID=1792845 RepID=A0A1S9PFE0_9SPHI|nr:histidine kinase [Mucilaginibacter pedocola]OOQ59647.1 hypothetical protein BC343_05650 [Mucilaginibacter pedocola]
MQFDKIVSFFLPAGLRDNKAHPQYHELRVVVSTCLIGLPLVLLFPVVLYYVGKPMAGYLINGALVTITLFSVKLSGHYRVPMSITALVTYYIIYDWIRGSGLIYSPNMSVLHMYLLAAIWADKRYGWWAIFSNLGWFVFIYYQTLHAGLATPIHSTLGGPLYALMMNCLITLFFGGFLAYLQFDQERDRLQIKQLQEKRITVLDDAVKKRTEQLNNMRESIATDFHDETGNMLSAITRQAALLKQKLAGQAEVQPVIEHIIRNSNNLYASSKDFLWHLNHNSDDPLELFNYLTGYGQTFYNQFDIAFSSKGTDVKLTMLSPSAALNIIYIFKEAMTNVAKHADATEVWFEMGLYGDTIRYSLQDNGRWKEPDTDANHFGLENMKRRCQKNGFVCKISTEPTKIEIAVPVINLS